MSGKHLKFRRSIDVTSREKQLSKCDLSCHFHFHNCAFAISPSRNYSNVNSHSKKKEKESRPSDEVSSQVLVSHVTPTDVKFGIVQ